MFVKVVLVFLALNLVTNYCFVNCEDNVVKTSSGSVRGQTIHVLNKSIEQFLGIPYAEPPVGSLRFAKPKPISKPITGIIDATKAKNSCMQKTGGVISTDLKVSEDCLVLNIWSPKSIKNNLKPVMFWIHGGGLQSGSIFTFIYNGSVLAAQDVVVVSANYRLGNFGFLYAGDDSAPGNAGLYDQVLALKWVRDNIHLFGGDKNQITIFGESAGSRSVSTHIVSPVSRSLFKRAIMESGSNLHYIKRHLITKDEALNSAKQLAKQHNCTDDKQWLQCLRKVDAKELTNVNNVITFPLEDTEFLPYTVQDAFNQSKYAQDIDLLAGIVQNEGSLLSVAFFPRLQNKTALTHNEFDSLLDDMNGIYHGLNLEDVKKFYLKNRNSSNSDDLRQALYDLFGDLDVKCPVYYFAKHFSEHTPKASTYFYELTYQSKLMQQFGCDPKTMGICHGAELEFVFGLPLLHPLLYKSEDHIFSKEVVIAWTNFAKTGNPGDNWVKILDKNVVKMKTLRPGLPKSFISNPFEESCGQFWKTYFN